MCAHMYICKEVLEYGLQKRNQLGDPCLGRNNVSTTSVLKYFTPLTFFIRLTIRLIYKYLCKLINLQAKPKYFNYICSGTHFTWFSFVK